MSLNTLHFYTTGSVPLEIYGQAGICICTIWNGGPNTPYILWGVPQAIWDTLSDKGAEVTPSTFAGEGAKFTLTHIQSSDWDVN